MALAAFFRFIINKIDVFAEFLRKKILNDLLEVMKFL